MLHDDEMDMRLQQGGSSGSKAAKPAGHGSVKRLKASRSATECALALLTSGTVEETPLQRPSTVTLQPAGAAPPPRPRAPKPSQDTHLLKLTQDFLTSRAWHAVQALGMASPCSASRG